MNFSAIYQDIKTIVLLKNQSCFMDLYLFICEFCAYLSTNLLPEYQYKNMYSKLTSFFERLFQAALYVNFTV